MVDTTVTKQLPSLGDSKYGCVLFLGVSGSGKSYALKQIVQQLVAQAPSTTIYTVNVRDEEYLSNVTKRIVPATFATLNSVKNDSIVLVEDIINLTNKEEARLRELLNWDAHHKSLKVFCVAHNIFKTKLFNTLSYFQFVVFTSSFGNLKLLKNCLSYFQLEQNVSQKWLDKFRTYNNAKGIYFYYCAAGRNFFATDNLNSSVRRILLGNADEIKHPAGSKDEVNDIEKLQNRFELFLKGREQAQSAAALFSIVINCVSLKNVRLHDLTLAFALKNGGIKRVSLVDYINQLLMNPPPGQTPPTDLLALHKYITKHCTIPEIFVRNQEFLKH